MRVRYATYNRILLFAQLLFYWQDTLTAICMVWSKPVDDTLHEL